jgi:diguanylate cyclase (GGDEF)-like protein
MKRSGETRPMIDPDCIGVPAFAVEVLPDGAFRYVDVNAACRLKIGVGDDVFRGRTPQECQEPALAARVVKRYTECVERGGVVEYDVSAQFPTGFMDWRTWIMPIRGPAGTVTHLLGICSDLTLADRGSELRDANRQLSLALQALKGANWTYDVETGRYTASDAFALLMGEGAPRPVNWAEWRTHILLGDRPTASCDRLAEGKAESEVVEFRFRKTSGEVCWAQCRRMAVQDGGPRRVCGVVVDVTDERRREEALIDLASRDPLTGLLNRRGFKREAERAALSASDGQDIALLLIDLDHFKSTNDTFGHPAGDAVLAEVGRRLPSALGLDAVCARLGGDEFVALYALRPGESPETLRAAIVSALGRPVVHEGRHLPLAASVGFATARGALNVGELMARADSALYAEKRARRRRPTRAA